MTLWKPLFEQVMADRIDVSHRGVRSPMVRTNLVYIHWGGPLSPGPDPKPDAKPSIYTFLSGGATPHAEEKTSI